MKVTEAMWLTTAVMLVMGLNAGATMIDLTTAGAESDPVNGAIFKQATFDTATGTGLFDPFVRLEKPQGSAGEEQGYNTEGVTEWETKDNNQWTHAIQLKDVPIVGDFYEFLLDINQNQGGDGELLSLDELKIHVVPESVGGSLTGYPNIGISSFGTVDWDLDAGGDNWIKLDYSLNPGSGNGDMIALIPIAALGTTGTDYVYLYSKFGVNCPANDGFEEWGIVDPVPEPATMILLGLGSILLRRRK